MRDLSALRVSPLLRATQPAAPQPAERAAQPASTLATTECATLATTTSSAERTAKPSPRLASTSRFNGKDGVGLHKGTGSLRPLRSINR